jgi:hypothetical protein
MSAKLTRYSARQCTISQVADGVMSHSDLCVPLVLRDFYFAGCGRQHQCCSGGVGIREIHLHCSRAVLEWQFNCTNGRNLNVKNSKRK